MALATDNGTRFDISVVCSDGYVSPNIYIHLKTKL